MFIVYFKNTLIILDDPKLLFSYMEIFLRLYVLFVCLPAVFLFYIRVFALA